VMVPIQDAFQVPLPPVPVPTSTTGANKGQHQHQAATTGVLGGGADYSAPVTITGMHDEILVSGGVRRVLMPGGPTISGHAGVGFIDMHLSRH
jgi:hypothetical protein